MNPILFLDIDGVLNRHFFNEQSECCGIDDDLMHNLNDVYLSTHCDIILSSAWRYMLQNGDMNIKGFEYMLRTHGLHKDIKIIDRTLYDEVIRFRGQQILWSLDRHNIKNYAIVDDLSKGEMCEGLTPTQSHFILSRLVTTDPNEGLNFEKKNSLITLLKGE